MALPKRYNPKTAEPILLEAWQESGVYHFSRQSDKPVYSIDTPPPTVSGHLHLGHVYSYSHADFFARFWRMNGHNVFYPMGYDDNGLATGRLVEKRLNIRATEIGREAFIEKCLTISEEAEKDYEALWKRLGLSIDWRYTYRTIDDNSRKTAQRSFIQLHQKGLVYRQEAPNIWCPECGTAIAQAEVNDLERTSEYVDLAFRLADGETLTIATTRPELLPACVAVFVHPEDTRYRHLVGRTAIVPLFGQEVSILEDPGADPDKGTGAVMCCTFGDTADVAWQRIHKLPLVSAVERDGTLSEAAGRFAGLSLEAGRKAIKAALDAEGLLLGRQPTEQTVRVHERCDTPVEYILTPQWFIRVLDFKDELLEAGEKVIWHPPHMLARYRAWVEGLNWDWCISRQRYYGAPFPVWYCDQCGEATLAEEGDLPVDPLAVQPSTACVCGGTSFTPEENVMDTWATSSHSPQLAGQWLDDPALYDQISPFSLRAQAHEIIRTWAFYTIVKYHFHHGDIPWKEAAISGWGLAPEGGDKISKSRGGGPVGPMEMIEQYSADAVRYWTASTGLGKDARISEEKIQTGAKLVTKLWNVARFSQRFLEGYQPSPSPPPLTPADAWILSRTQRLIQRVTALFKGYDYAAAKSEMESFFWRDLADNYLEMAKQRLYDPDHPMHAGARFALFHALLSILKVFAPILPYVTEEIFQGMFAEIDGSQSIHNAQWPEVNEGLLDEEAEIIGEALLEIATAVRRYKSEHSLSLGTELERLQLATQNDSLAKALESAKADIMSVTRAKEIELVDRLDGNQKSASSEGQVQVGIFEFLDK